MGKILEKSVRKIRMKRFISINWREVIKDLPIEPKDTLICCDLRDCILDQMDLSKVTFFGCRLNGTSFRGATLKETQFIGCFSSHHGSPTDFQNCFWQDVFVVNSHLNYLSDQNLTDFRFWSAEVADAAADTLSEMNDIRYNAATRLGALKDSVVAPILACLLADEEWDVRSIALEVLGKLDLRFLDTNRELLLRFPNYDRVLFELMFLCLGDRHSIVRQTAIELVETLSPPDDILLTSVTRIKADYSEERIAGLLAAIELCRLDGKYYRLLDLNNLLTLLSDEVAEVRSECLHLLGIIDDRSTIPWLLMGLSDPVYTVRIAALCAIKLLREAPPVSSLIPLLKDPNEEVRIEVLYTIGQLGDFDKKDLEMVFSDPSIRVRELAQNLFE